MLCGNRFEYGKEYKIENQYTPDSWINGKEKVTVEGTNNAYMYFIIEDNEMAEDYTIAVNKRISDLLIGGCRKDSTGCGIGDIYYYLASRTEAAEYGGDFEELVNFYLMFVLGNVEYGEVVPEHVFSSIGYESYSPIYAGVRPVIS